LTAAEEEAAAVIFQDVSAGGDINVAVYIRREERPPLFAGVPAMPPHFVGRDEVVGRLVERLTTGQEYVIALEGLPGVGKTTLAVALSHHRRVLNHFEDGVLWASLGPQGDPFTALAHWAQAFGKDISSLIRTGRPS
jgi:hypothetical protein